MEAVLDVTPQKFEQLVIELLKAMGYGRDAGSTAEAIGKSGDGGIDGVIDQDPLGLDSVYVQAKRYKPGKNIGSPVIHNFSGSLDAKNANKGVLVTTSDFTPSAIAAAERMPKRIVLINGTRLVSLMARHGIGVRVEERLTIQKVDEDFFSQLG